MIPPTRSRRTRGLILLTFGEASDPQRASGGGLKFLVFDGLACASLAPRSSSKALP
jgi:hypothetical protein